MNSKYEKPTNSPEPGSADPDLAAEWPFGHRVGFRPDLTAPAGDTVVGVLRFRCKDFQRRDRPKVVVGVVI